MVTAKDGEDAITEFKKHQSDIVAVVLDMSMPRLSGEEVISQLQRLMQKIPVIVSSGYPKEEVLERFSGTVFGAFIQKPYRTQDLAKRLYLTLGLLKTEGAQ